MRRVSSRLSEVDKSAEDKKNQQKSSLAVRSCNTITPELSIRVYYEKGGGIFASKISYATFGDHERAVDGRGAGRDGERFSPQRVSQSKRVYTFSSQFRRTRRPCKRQADPASLLRLAQTIFQNRVWGHLSRRFIGLAARVA